MVEHDLAKVGVAGSSPVFRSKILSVARGFFLSSRTALVVIPGTDRIVPPGSARALAAALPKAEAMTPAAGHIGMMVGGRAEREVWQPIAAWLRKAA